MGQIANNLFRFSREKASIARNVEVVSSEVTEDCADELVFKASAALYTESDETDDEFIDSLERELPDTDEDASAEINRILAVDNEDIDIDDILGVVDVD